MLTASLDAIILAPGLEPIDALSAGESPPGCETLLTTLRRLSTDASASASNTAFLSTMDGRHREVEPRVRPLAGHCPRRPTLSE
jgi:hypothetical protein